MNRWLCGFLSGDRKRIYQIPGAPRVLPLICYEIIFPGAVAYSESARAGFSTSPTTLGSVSVRQYRLRVRAIEEGLPLVRAANNGISAVIDPVGRIVAQLSLGTEGVLDASLLRAQHRRSARVGDATFHHVDRRFPHHSDALPVKTFALNHFRKVAAIAWQTQYLSMAVFPDCRAIPSCPSC